MDDMLVEIDTRALKGRRHFMLGLDMEHGMAGAPKRPRRSDQAAGGHGLRTRQPAAAVLTHLGRAVAR